MIENLDSVLENIKTLSPALQIIPKIHAVVRDVDASPNDLAKVINVDPSLAAQVIKLSNSAFYAANAKVNNIEQAVQKLGFTEIYKLVAHASSHQSLNQSLDAYYIEASELWKHSITCAFFMEKMAKEHNINSQISYTVGLLHLLGKNVINEHFLDEYAQVYTHIEKEQIELPLAEKKVFGYNHAEIGAALLRKWNFPDEIVIPILHQYEPLAEEEHQVMTLLLHLSNWALASVGLNSGKDAWAISLEPKATDILNLSPSDIEQLPIIAAECRNAMIEFQV